MIYVFPWVKLNFRASKNVCIYLNLLWEHTFDMIIVSLNVSNGSVVCQSSSLSFIIIDFNFKPYQLN